MQSLCVLLIIATPSEYETIPLEAQLPETEKHSLFHAKPFFNSVKLWESNILNVFMLIYMDF